jgi:Na+-translocating ferredoxin:NAD+ oxidoreductase RnfC subunit
MEIVEEKTNEKEYKTKDYVRRAKLKYYKNRMKTDDIFLAKEKERIRKWREDNREIINERVRLRRLKKKQEKEAANGLLAKAKSDGVASEIAVEKVVESIGELKVRDNVE